METVLCTSSSDSEEDCYGGVAQKLQKMKNMFLEDKVENVLLLKPNSEIDDILKQNSSILKNHLWASSSSGTSKTGRSRRSKTNENSDSLLNLDVVTTSRGRGRGRGRSRGRGANATTVTEESPSTSTRGTSTRRRGTTTPRGRVPITSRAEATPRGRVSTPRRGRSTSRRATPRRRRGRTNGCTRREWYHECSNGDYSIPVGDIDYPDMSREQPLFSNTKAVEEVIPIEDELTDPLSENEELSVKVFWQNSDVFKFTVRKYQKIAHIFEFFSERESLSYDKILLTYNGRILKPSDTPDYIDYSIAKFIDGGVIKNSIVNMNSNSPVKSSSSGGDIIKIKFQCQTRKHPFEIKVFLDERISVGFLKCAEQLDVGIERLKFYFDGDVINPQATPRELEFEGGECIDVNFVN